MRGKIPWFVALGAMCVWILLSHARLPGLLDDSDTRGILLGIRNRNNPWSWFAGDWPLFNHFYRPISTLTFEFDWRVYGNWAEGYGLTNAILAVLSTLGCAWLASEVLEDYRLGVLTGIVFGLWSLDAMPSWEIPTAGILVSLLLALAVRKEMPSLLGAVLIGSFAVMLLNPVEPLHDRMLAWLPGRTASTMTVFLLPGIAAMLRYHKLGRWPWLMAGMILILLACASYEQGVVAPMVLACLIAFHGKQQGEQPRALKTWLYSLVPVALYVLVRFAVLPSGVSRYQNQQAREGMGIALSLGDYSLLPIRDWFKLQSTLEMGADSLLTTDLWRISGGFALLVGAVWSLIALKAWAMPLRLVLASFLAFLPMAFLHPFAHYHYAPMAIRAMLPVWLLAWCYREFIRLRNPAPNAESPEAPPASPLTSSS